MFKVDRKFVLTTGLSSRTDGERCIGVGGVKRIEGCGELLTVAAGGMDGLAV